MRRNKSRLKFCSAGKHWVEADEIAAHRNGENICIPCLNAQVKGPPRNRIIKGSQLLNRSE